MSYFKCVWGLKAQHYFMGLLFYIDVIQVATTSTGVGEGQIVSKVFTNHLTWLKYRFQADWES